MLSLRSQLECVKNTIHLIHALWSVNAFPTAPEYDFGSAQNLYPKLSLQPDFRSPKINKIALKLKQEVNHYRIVSKKYKRARNMVNWSSGGSRFLSAAFSISSYGSALSVVGLSAVVLVSFFQVG